MQSLLVVLFIYLVINMVFEVARLRHQYLIDVWNYVDVLVIILVLASFSLFVTLYVRDDVTRVRAAIGDDSFSYVSLTKSAILQDVCRSINAVLLWLLYFIVRTFIFFLFFSARWK